MDSKDLKIFACDVIQNVGFLLSIPQVALATAQMLLHRVYDTPDYNIKDHPIDMTAMATIFLAAKVEESTRKAREVIDVVTLVISKKFKRDIRLNYTDHDKLKAELFDTEKRILKESGFDLLSIYPHKMLVNYYHALVRILDEDQNVWTEAVNRTIVQRAWNYCNDCLRSDIFCRYSQETVVCACINKSLQDNNLLFPKSSCGQPWYSLFIEKESNVTEAMEMIARIYDKSDINLKLVEPYLRLSSYFGKPL